MLKKNLYIAFSIFIILSLFSCTEDTIVNNTDSHQKVVLLSDNDLVSEETIRIKGFISTNFPSIDVEYLPARSFDIEEAAYTLEIASENYPAGTIFIGNVDPGSSSRKIVFETADGKFFLVPDNGLATRVIKKSGVKDFYYIDNKDFFDGKAPAEIDNGTLFIGAVNALLRGARLDSFGEYTDKPVTYPIADAKLENGIVSGDILFADSFGNCITNISDSLLSGFKIGELLKVRYNGKSFFATYGLHYGSVPVGQNVIMMDGTGYLKMSVNYGSIKDRYSVKAGTQIQISKASLKIGILQYNASSVVSDIINGMKAELAAAGLVEGVNLEYIHKNANGDKAAFPSLISELINRDIDILIPISTSASQAAIELTPDSIPVVFTYVTDPESAGILGKRKNVCGLSDVTNFKDYIEFAKTLLPNMKKAGTVYNNTESNSVYAQNQLISLSNIYGYELIQAISKNTNEISAAYQNINSQSCDALLIVADNTLSLGMSELADLAIEDKMPLIGDSFQHAQDGALASISVDYDALAKSTGELTLAVIRGINPDNEQVRKFSTNVIALNTETASKIGFIFSDVLKNKAKFIFP